MTSPTTQAAIAAAMSNARPDDVIAGIKEAVAREFEGLDPDATIAVTDYFNHSFVPDMVIRWRGSEKQQERPVFLRFTLRAAVIGEDVSALSSSGPIVLALKPDDQDEAARATVRQSAKASPRLLLTDVSTLGQAATTLTKSATPPSPLLTLVQKSIVRGARGVLDPTTMQELNSSTSPAVTPAGETDTNLLANFDRLVSEVFVEDAAFQLRRSAEILRIGLSEDADSILAAANDADPDLLRGLLSNVELSTLLPFLLSRPDVTQSPLFWAQVGSMIDLASLERMSHRLEGIDLKPLVLPNLDTWKANRAYLTSTADDDAHVEAASEATTLEEDNAVDEATGWRVRSGLLSLAISDWRLILASDGRRLRGRPDAPQARWSDLESVLADFELSRVLLTGIERTVEIGAAGERDVRGDVRAITSNVEDDYFVPLAHVRERGTAESDFIRAEFSTMLAVARTSASIRSLARTAIRILGYRYPTSTEDLERVLG